MRLLKVLGCALLFLAGYACGAASFIGTQKRPLLLPGPCHPSGKCLTDPELLGLIASVGLHVAPGLLPDVVGRSRDCIGIDSPDPEGPVDLVFFPTRDIRNLLDLSPGDEVPLMDCFALMRQVADQRRLRNWKIVTNGPGAQRVGYLHFHLMIE